MRQTGPGVNETFASFFPRAGGPGFLQQRDAYVVLQLGVILVEFRRLSKLSQRVVVVSCGKKVVTEGVIRDGVWRVYDCVFQKPTGSALSVAIYLVAAALAGGRRVIEYGDARFGGALIFVGLLEGD